MRILLAIDGSSSSIQARDLVASLPWPAGTTVTLLTVYSVPVTWFTPGLASADWLVVAEDTLREQAQAELAVSAAALQRPGWTVEQRVIAGRAADAIMAVADAGHADLIVLGSRGHGRIRSMLLGSVSAEVADHARQSVLVARGDRVSRVLVATDGSECATAVPDAIAGWGGLRGLPAVACSVAPVDSPAYQLMVSLYKFGEEPMNEQNEALIAQHARVAQEMAIRLTDIGLPAEADTRRGDAADEIVKAAADHKADLVITGSRCLHGMDRVILGSVARGVLLHADASVLIVRPKAS